MRYRELLLKLTPTQLYSISDIQRVSYCRG